MINVNSKAPLEDILPFVKDWLKLLAEGKLAEACAQIDEPYYENVWWTPVLIMKIVHDVFRPETRFYQRHPEGPFFANPYELDEQTQMLDDWLDNDFDTEDDSVYYFDYDVPLNGEWSDLSAQFEFHKRNGGYAVMLRDLHVM